MTVIDLRSDTITQPTDAMRAAMRDADVGDDFYGEDPTVRALEERSAALTGKEAALLVPSGTMGNLLAILAQTRQGDAIVVGGLSHIYLNEAGNISAVAGVLPRLVEDADGCLDPARIEAALQPSGILHAPATLLAIENTHNSAGGRCTRPQRLEEIAATARRLRLRIHCDGARLFNAAVALSVPAAELAAAVHSLTFCLSKGLACPFGSLLVGEAAFIQEARHWRQRLGGGFRQVGVVAAAGLVALDGMIERLAEDHAQARALARGLQELGLPVDPSAVETNMVFVELPDAFGDPGAFTQSLAEAGVRINTPRGRRARFVTHLGIDGDAVTDAVHRIGQVAKGATHARAAA